VEQEEKELTDFFHQTRNFGRCDSEIWWIDDLTGLDKLHDVLHLFLIGLCRVRQHQRTLRLESRVELVDGACSHDET